MSPTSSLHLKILSLAVVIWGLVSHVMLSYQGAGWVPWMALVMLMLLEAYSSDAKPAAWSRWSAGLKQVMSPGMLPYYAVLMLGLAFGPGQMRHAERPTPYMGPVSPALAGSPNRMMPPAGYPNAAGPGQPVRPQGFPSAKIPRPVPTAPGAAGATVGAPAAGQAGLPPVVMAKPVPVPVPAGQAAGAGTIKAAQPAVTIPPAGSAAMAPTSSAKPVAVPPPTK